MFFFQKIPHPPKKWAAVGSVLGSERKVAELELQLSDVKRRTSSSYTQAVPSGPSPHLTGVRSVSWLVGGGWWWWFFLLGEVDQLIKNKTINMDVSKK